MGVTGNGGSRVAQLRKEREVTQVALTRRARVSLSLLSKIEVGDRALTPAIAAAVARALQISLGAFYGEAEISPEQNVLLEDLRTAVRRYDIPDQAPEPDPAQLRIEVDQAITLKEQTDLAGLLRMPPSLLTRATTHAHAAASQPATQSPRGSGRRPGPCGHLPQLRGLRRWTHRGGSGHRGRRN